MLYGSLAYLSNSICLVYFVVETGWKVVFLLILHIFAISRQLVNHQEPDHLNISQSNRKPLSHIFNYSIIPQAVVESVHNYKYALE